MRALVLTQREPRPLFQIWPGLSSHVGFEVVGDFPTRVERLRELAPGFAGNLDEVWVKRDDLSSAVYGGNKVRTLEPLFGQARREGRSSVYATGAYGSNHAVATVLHGKRLGFHTGVILFPQPFSAAAAENLRVSVARADDIVDLPHWSLLPGCIAWRRFRERRQPPLIMPPGGAIPRGCLGFVSGALELGMQIQSGDAPCPREILIALGSTCSTAGLLVGLRVAARLGLGFGPGAPPRLIAVRVTPWPVTSRFRVLRLAVRVARWLHALTGDERFAMDRAELAAGLTVEGGYLGAGYGRPTPSGLRAIESLSPFSRALDTTYSSKSAAALLDRARDELAGPRLFWSTKSGAALPEVSELALAAAPRRMRRWLRAGG